MTLSEEDIEYFQRGEHENPKFFSRLGGLPLLDGLKVMDVGCGHGSLCVLMSRSGARWVLGIDIDRHRVEFASENLSLHYPELTSKCEFRCCDVSEVAESDFDLIVSKDSFEHIIDAEGCVAAMAARLRPGGRIYIGFGPLYKSPFGDHGRTGARVPWGHLIIPESVLLRRLSKAGKQRVGSVFELGLNKLGVSDFETIFRSSGLQVEYMRVNASRHPVSKLFSLVGRVRPLRDYFSHNLYCVLRKPS